MPFASMKLHRHLLAGLRELGYSRPTPIQTQAIPPALEGRDVLACAMTGSGKTAAFLLPILEQLMDRPRGTTRALVLTPTRELAAQVAQSCDEIAVHTGITAAAIFGGVSMGPQEHAFRSGVDVLVATPGRLLDHLGKRYARLDGVEHLVLDEADRMLDMGFLPDVRRILARVPADRQTLFFSATMPPPIAALAKEMLSEPVTINLQRQSQPAVGITQAVYPVPQELKAHLLVELLRRGDVGEALVFTRTKHRANRLALHLDREGVSSDRIHGNRSQSQRTQALAAFKEGRTRVLVATDIAARGIDVEALGHVVNFDVPKAPEDYVHRIGRTGRAELTGDAFTFVAPDEEPDLRDIEKVLGKRLPRIVLPDFDYAQRPSGKLEVPLKERLAAMRAQRQGRGARPQGQREGQGRARQPQERPGPRRPGASGRGGGAASGRGGGAAGRGRGAAAGRPAHHGARPARELPPRPAGPPPSVPLRTDRGESRARTREAAARPTPVPAPPVHRPGPRAQPPSSGLRLPAEGADASARPPRRREGSPSQAPDRGSGPPRRRKPRTR